MAVIGPYMGPIIATSLQQPMEKKRHFGKSEKVVVYMDLAVIKGWSLVEVPLKKTKPADYRYVHVQ